MLVTLSISEEMGKSMMTRFCQIQRLKRKSPPVLVGPAKANGGKFELDENSYTALLRYYQDQDPAWADYRTVSLPESAKVLTPYATEVQSMEATGGFKFNKGDGNKVVEYMVDGVQTWGIVIHCLQVTQGDMGTPDSLVCIWRLEVISNPQIDNLLRRIGVIRLKDVTVHIFIPAAKVSATRSYRLLPAWSLGYAAPSMLVNVAENIVEEFPFPL
ncbi:hypothetical protein DFH28DRAFT_905644 [Melampsora americana]|nr:hypothetical protein DFH28DRAFT_905644 [Melampsora americana]